MVDVLHDVASLLSESRRRSRARARAEHDERIAIERAIEERRSRFHAAAETCLADLTEQQLGFICDPRSLVAALCSRRAGKTFSIARALIAFALVTPRSRQIYINETLGEAKALLWDEPDDGFLAVLDRLGLNRGDKRKDLDRGKDYFANEAELVLRFANGSLIYLVGADNPKQANKLRGRKVHRVVVDEAQKLPAIDNLVKRVLGASIKDLKGQIWLIGTPGIDCAGYFYRITNVDATDEDRAGFSVHRWSVRDNPFFGRVRERDDGMFEVVDQEAIVVSAAVADRVQAEALARVHRWKTTAEDAKVENGWDEDDPDFRREWGGEWVREDARYVIHVHKVPTDRLIFAPLRTSLLGEYDHAAAVKDLPTEYQGRRIEWLFALGGDIGFDPDPTAIVIWAFSFEHPDSFEMWSWKKSRIHNDERAVELRKILDQVDIAVGVADAGGLGKELVDELRTRYSLPLYAADKAHKWARIETFNTEIRTGRIHFRGQAGVVLTAQTCSPLLWEALNLVYLPRIADDGKPKIHKYRKLPDKSAPGDHCIDAGIYGHHHCMNFRFVAAGGQPKAGTPEHDNAVESAIEDAIDREQDEDNDYGSEYA